MLCLIWILGPRRLTLSQIWIFYIVRKPNSFVLVVELTNADDTDVQWHFCINFEPKTFDHVNNSFFSTWLAFEITGQSFSCSLARKATNFLWRHLCNAFIHLWRNGRSISSFRSALVLAGCNGRKLTGRSKPRRGILNE